jgi:hypothetical protein
MAYIWCGRKVATKFMRPNYGGITITYVLEKIPLWMTTQQTVTFLIICRK